MLQGLVSWFKDPAFEVGLACFSVVALLASIVFVPRFLAKLPPNYLERSERREPRPLLLRVLRNVLGAVLVLLGVAMLLLPGQGLLTLLVGLLMLDFPGKHALVVKLLSRPKVLSIVNALRARRGAAPLHA